MTKATARKTSLENKHLRNCDYLHANCPILFAFYNVGRVSYNWTSIRAVKLTRRIKDLRLYAQVVNLSVNMVISRSFVLRRKARTCS